MLIVLLLFLSFLVSSCGYKTKDCITCFGSGKANCSTCYGTGKVNCLQCNGQGDTYCTNCGGQGKQYRYDWGYDYANGGGYSYHYDRFPCQNCSGTGRVTCPNADCNDGKVSCTAYGCVDGKADCTWCKGTGNSDNEERGFFSGLIDGFLVLFSFIRKVIGTNISVYALKNSGLFYWVGFGIGALSFVGLLGGSKKG